MRKPPSCRRSRSSRKILGINYVETTDVNQAEFRLITTTSAQYGAYFYPQDDAAYGTQQGIGAFNIVNRGWNEPGPSADPNVTTDGLQKGGFAYAVILHEFGHAHGLAHPHDTGGGSEILLGVTGASSLGLFDLNQGVYTVMSYNDGWQTHPDGALTAGGDPVGFRSDAGWAATLTAFDIATLAAALRPAPAQRDRRHDLHASRLQRRRQLVRVHLGHRRHRHDRIYRRHPQRGDRPHRRDDRLFADRRRRAVVRPDPARRDRPPRRSRAASPSPTAW